MGNVVQYKPHVHFGLDILKYEKNGSMTQRIIIVLRRKGSPYTLISPVTSMLDPFITLSVKTNEEYGRRLVDFLNYSYFVSKNTKSFSDFCPDQLISYLKHLTKTKHTRDYVERSMQILTRMFYYITEDYPHICKFKADDFLITASKKRTVVQCPKVEAGFLLPPKKTNLARKKNKTTYLEMDLVIRFILTAVLESPNIALGLYFIFFGGCRVSEVLHLTSEDIPSVFSSSNFTIILRDKILSTAKYSDINQNKRPRKQEVFMIRDLYYPLYTEWKRKYKSGAIVQNRDGNPMGYKGFWYHFNKIKKKLISDLRQGTVSDKHKAFILETYDWSTHIGRGTFSNIINEHTDNPYLVSVKRGDSSFDSVLPYLSSSDKMNSLIIQEIENTFRKLKGER